MAWSQGGDIWATRVTRAGAVLDDPPLPIGRGAGLELSPAIGWTGRHFLVAWQSDGDLVGARVSEQGALLDAPPFGLAQTPELERSPQGPMRCW